MGLFSRGTSSEKNNFGKGVLGINGEMHGGIHEKEEKPKKEKMFDTDYGMVSESELKAAEKPKSTEKNRQTEYENVSDAQLAQEGDQKWSWDESAEAKPIPFRFECLGPG